MDACAGVEFYNGILVPDFVNAHCHLELSYLKGAIPQGGGFTAFARGMGEVRGLKGPEERQLAAAEADRQMWRQGIGGVGDVCNGDSSFAVKAASPVDYLSFLELFGLGASSAPGAGAARTACGGLRAALYGHPPCYLFLAGCGVPFGRGIGYRAAFRTLYGESCGA